VLAATLRHGAEKAQRGDRIAGWETVLDAVWRPFRLVRWCVNADGAADPARRIVWPLLLVRRLVLTAVARAVVDPLDAQTGVGFLNALYLVVIVLWAVGACGARRSDRSSRLRGTVRASSTSKCWRSR
jgi:hypothetical protein